MKIEITGTPDFRFQARNEEGQTFAIGASKAIGGHEEAFRPMQLVLAAVGSCSAIDVVNILKKSRVEFRELGIEVEAERKPDATPAPFTRIHVKFLVRGGKEADLPKAEKAASLGVEKYCSVAASLDPSIRLTHSTHIVP